MASNDPEQDDPGAKDHGEWAFSHLDTNYGQPGYAFGEAGYLTHHKALMTGQGYLIERYLAREANRLYDNQVWLLKRADTGTLVACKISSLAYYRERAGGSGAGFEDTKAALLRESQVLPRLSHENIIKVTQVFGLRDPHSGFPYSFHCVVMELMSGTLADLQDKYPNGCMPETAAAEWFTQMARAVQYLHRGIDGAGTRVSHLAIKPLNILYKTIDESRGLRVFKLIDFEESVVFAPSAPDLYPPDRTYSRNPYSAPETRRKNGGPQNKPTRPMDVYSLAITLICCLIGRDIRTHDLYFRYSAGQLELQYLNPIDADLFANLHRDLVGLLRPMLAPANRRPSIDQVCQHRWFQS